MKAAKLKIPGDEGRARAYLKSTLDTDEDGLRHLLSKQEPVQNKSASGEEPTASSITGCIACATGHVSSTLVQHVLYQLQHSVLTTGTIKLPNSQTKGQIEADGVGQIFRISYKQAQMPY